MSYNDPRAAKPKPTAAQLSMEKQEAFYAGYRDQREGKPRTTCPDGWSANARRGWWEGWDKAAAGFMINLPDLPTK